MTFQKFIIIKSFKLDFSRVGIVIVCRTKSMSRPVLHYWAASPAARICELVIRYLDLDVEVRSDFYHVNLSHMVFFCLSYPRYENAIFWITKPKSFSN